MRSASPATVRTYGYALREPGTRARRGGGVSAGRIMAAFGDTAAADVEPREVSAWLRQLDAEGLTARNVNEHRKVLLAVFKYGCRHDTYALDGNPVESTDKRREAPPGRLDVYDVEEVEALARAAAAGAHRKPRGRARATHDGPDRPAALSARQRARQDDEAAHRAREDA